MLMRVAVGIHNEDIAAAIETYNLLSEKWFTHASPTLFNAGTNRPQLSRYTPGREIVAVKSLNKRGQFGKKNQTISLEMMRAFAFFLHLH